MNIPSETVDIFLKANKELREKNVKTIRYAKWIIKT